MNFLMIVFRKTFFDNPNLEKSNSYIKNYFHQVYIDKYFNNLCSVPYEIQ